MTMQVVNRKGEREDVRFDAIHEKLRSLSHGLDPVWVDPGHVTKLTIEGLYDGVTTRELDQLAAETAASIEFRDHVATRSIIHSKSIGCKNGYPQNTMFEQLDPRKTQCFRSSNVKNT